MPSLIKQLSEQTINQIAAGEVIENPASVVKELVENALDAKASRIVVEVQGGGYQLLRISDNGSGMGPEDALLCLERHATSKIQKVEDLDSLGTMGFRGEALASIAAISKLTLSTSEGGIAGTKIEVEGGKILSTGPCARTQGTTIEVRSLFYNVPARKKFQKSPAVSLVEITRMLTALSLAYPQVSFELVHQGKLLFKAETPPLEGPEQLFLEKRIFQVLGEEFSKGIFPVLMEEKDYRCWGVVGSPSHTRHNRTGQYLFINRRSVTSPPISYAIKDGYGTRLAPQRHPVYVLHFALCPSSIDVNVHPQKKEVRFKEEKWIKDKIQETVARALQAVEAVSVSFETGELFEDFPSLASSGKELQEQKKEKDAFFAETPSSPHPLKRKKEEVSPQKASEEKEELPDWVEEYHATIETSSWKELPANSQEGVKESVAFEPLPPSFPMKISEASSASFSLREEGVSESLIPPFSLAGEIPESFLPKEEEKPKAIGLFSSYLLLEAGSVSQRVRLPDREETYDGILLVDLLAAKARIAFDVLLKQGKKESQMLLFPVKLELSLAEAQLVIAQEAFFKELGIAIFPVGKQTFLVEALPSYIPEGETVSAIREIIHTLSSEGEKLSFEEKRKRELASVVSRFVKMGKNSFLLSEALLLFEELLKTQDPYQCPQGKPTMVHLSTYALSRYFLSKKK